MLITLGVINHDTPSRNSRTLAFNRLCRDSFILSGCRVLSCLAIASYSRNMHSYGSYCAYRLNFNMVNNMEKLTLINFCAADVTALQNAPEAGLLFAVISINRDAVLAIAGGPQVFRKMFLNHIFHYQDGEWKKW